MRRQPTNDLYGLAGTIQGRYRLLKHIGRGGFGDVYQAQHLPTGLTVAMKVLSTEIVAESPEVASLFLEKAVTMAGLRHPSLPMVTDAGTVADGSARNTSFVVMEWIEGHTLRDELKERAVLPLERVTFIVEQVCEVLDYLHSNRIVHRDIKPSNIMLAPDRHRAETVKLLDFGVVKNPSSTFGNYSLFIGSPQYTSPEQFAGAEIDHSADIYSLGVVAYEMLTGELPFNSSSLSELIQQHISAVPKSLRRLRPEIPKSVEGVINTALAKRPGDRYRSAPEMARAFRCAAGMETGQGRAKGCGAARGGGMDGTELNVVRGSVAASLDADFDAEVKRIGALPIEEVRNGLRQIGIEPTQKLPPYLRQLRAAQAPRRATTSDNEPLEPFTPTTFPMARDYTIPLAACLLLSLGALFVYALFSAPFGANVPHTSASNTPRVQQTLTIWLDSSQSNNELEIRESVSALLTDLKRNSGQVDGVRVIRFGMGNIWGQRETRFSWGKYPVPGGDGATREYPGSSFPGVDKSYEKRQADAYMRAVREYESQVNVETERLGNYLSQRQQAPRAARCTSFESLSARIAAEGLPLNLLLTDGRDDCPDEKPRGSASASGNRLLIVLLPGGDKIAGQNYARRERMLKQRFPNAQLIPASMSGRAVSALMEQQ